MAISFSHLEPDGERSHWLKVNRKIAKARAQTSATS